jgi:hypothetical protein
MRRLVIALVGAAAISALLASSAAANTTVAVKMTFAEPIVPGIKGGCPVAPDGFCGSGQVIPLGQATETIAFNAGCSGNCDRRTITLASGSIFLDETFSDGTCPGVCQPNPAEPGSGTLTDVVIGGTEAFTGATGSLTGTVRAAGLQSTVMLSGTIHYDP